MKDIRKKTVRLLSDEELKKQIERQAIAEAVLKKEMPDRVPVNFVSQVMLHIKQTSIWLIRFIIGLSLREWLGIILILILSSLLN